MSDALDLVSLDNALKVIYSKQAVIDETLKNRPLHAMIGKETDFGGKSFTVDVITSLTQGRSAQFANAQANKTSIEIDQFNIYRAYDYSLASVDLWALFASQGDRNAMLDAMTKAINSSRETLMRSAVIAEYRDGTGEIGRVQSITTGANGYFTLTNPLDVLNFEKGQALNFFAASNASPASDNFYSGSGVQHVTGAAKSIVTKVDPLNAKVTCDSIPTDAATTNGGDHITADGDYVYNSNGSGQGGIAGFGKISGLAAWLPSAGPTTTKFMSLDRTDQPQRLAGVVSVQSGKADDEALLNASRDAFLYGGASITHFFVSPNRFNNIVKYLGSAVRYVDVKAGTKGTIGFRAIEVMGQGGTVKVIADPNCPDALGYGLTLANWKLKTLRQMPTFLNLSGKTLLEQNANRVEVRVGYAGNIYTNAPGYNVVVVF